MGLSCHLADQAHADTLKIRTGLERTLPNFDNTLKMRTGLRCHQIDRVTLRMSRCASYAVIAYHAVLNLWPGMVDKLYIQCREALTCPQLVRIECRRSRYLYFDATLKM